MLMINSDNGFLCSHALSSGERVYDD